jgi:transcriptional regulator with XRE-family HTH domain
MSGCAALLAGRGKDAKIFRTASPWLKQLGDNVRRERIAQDLSQQQLAEMADLNIRNVQRIEAGEIDVLLRTMVRIRKALNCPLEKLMPRTREAMCSPFRAGHPLANRPFPNAYRRKVERDIEQFCEFTGRGGSEPYARHNFRRFACDKKLFQNRY